jgi:hypothetical protein
MNKFRLFHKCIPKGPYVVRYSLHDKYKGTHYYQELEFMAGSYSEGINAKIPSSGHIISVTINLRKYYVSRPIEELIKMEP